MYFIKNFLVLIYDGYAQVCLVFSVLCKQFVMRQCRHFLIYFKFDCHRSEHVEVYSSRI
jgi:hypothetical protein